MNLALGIVAILLAVVVSVTAVLLVRRRAPEGGYFEDGDRAAGVFGVLATGFAIVAGFVIFLAFTSYDQSRTGAEAEALVVVQQWETAQFLPASVRERLSGELLCYARTVVHREWPEMESGASRDTLNPWSVALFGTLQQAKPTSATEQSNYDKWLDQTSEREEARRDRIHGAAGIIPFPIWLVLFLTASVIFVFMLFFADSAERAVSQGMLIGSATAVVVTTLLAIYALDNPYRPGPGSLQPIAMERSLVLFEEARAAVNDTSEPPCDENGVAR